ncbi:MAG: hypothetical protein ACOCRX_07070 [Candidatus Woesearchaeota archaeon]
MPRYNVKVDYMPGFKDCIWANNKEHAFKVFLKKYKLNPKVSYITTIQEIFELKDDYCE